MELRPTGALVEARRQRRRRRRQRIRRLQGNGAWTRDITWNDKEEEEEKEEELASMDVPEEWLHPWSRAIYATLHPPNDNHYDEEEEEKRLPTDNNKNSMGDPEDVEAVAYRDFVKYRHLSRFERQLRTELNWDLHPDWHGNYSDTPFYTQPLTTMTTTNPTHRTNSTHPLVQPRLRRHMLESLVGGKFDNYQGVPLSQGYGTHYVHLWVGSPTPQRQSVIVDTGSHFTGFPIKGTCVRWIDPIRSIVDGSRVGMG